MNKEQTRAATVLALADNDGVFLLPNNGKRDIQLVYLLGMYLKIDCLLRKI